MSPSDDEKRLTAKQSFNRDQTSLYGCLTGFELPNKSYQLSLDLELFQTHVDMFAAPMIAFGPPVSPGTHHPGPWVAVRGGFSFESRVELCVRENGRFDGFTTSLTAWLVAALCRLKIDAPVRLAALGNMSFNAMRHNEKEAIATAFEGANNHHGLFTITTAYLKEHAFRLPWMIWNLFATYCRPQHVFIMKIGFSALSAFTMKLHGAQLLS